MERKDLIAAHLLRIKAVFFRPDEPFTWASGIKSPVYCDNRLTLTDVAARTDVENGLAALIQEAYPGVEVLMGTSTAGIAHAAITGHLLGLPMGYVRSGAKDHGRKNQIEGRLLPGQKVVAICCQMAFRMLLFCGSLVASLILFSNQPPSQCWLMTT